MRPAAALSSVFALPSIISSRFRRSKHGTFQAATNNSSASTSSMEIIPFHEQPFLSAFAEHLRKRTFAERLRVNNLIQGCTELADRAVYCEMPAYRRIKELRVRIRTATRGIPQTEFLDDESPLVDKSHELTDAEQILLKKAYRKAAQLIHPERDTGNALMFRLLHEAYRSKNLRAVQEFVMHLDKPLLDQVGYWLIEVKMPAAQWIEYKAFPEYKLVQWIKQGQVEKARILGAELLRLSELHLQAQLIAVLARSTQTEEEEQGEMPADT